MPREKDNIEKWVEIHLCAALTLGVIGLAICIIGAVCSLLK
jgi:hypothetical protein